MSTQAPPPAPPVALASDKREIKIVSHSTLFYWWPVWVFGFILALLTWWDGHRLALAGPKTETQVVNGRKALVAGENENEMLKFTDYRISDNQTYGVLWTVALLLVIVITNVPLRGLWSVIVILVVLAASIIFGLLHWWGPILEYLGNVHIHINAAGYLIPSAILFVIWLVTFVFFDSQIYMVFTPGQMRVRQEVGDAETACDTAGMVVQKQRNDLFRHWILGMGSGDLIVKTSGAHPQHFDLPNVLFVGHKVSQIEEMLREKPVVRG